MNWRRTAAWMLVVALLAGLTGCGNPEGARNVKDNTTDITATEAP